MYCPLAPGYSPQRVKLTNNCCFDNLYTPHRCILTTLLFWYNKTSLENVSFILSLYLHSSTICSPTDDTSWIITLMSIVQVIVVCSSPKAKTLSKPEPVQTGIKLCPQGIPVWPGFTVYNSFKAFNTFTYTYTIVLLGLTLTVVNIFTLNFEW